MKSKLKKYAIIRKNAFEPKSPKLQTNRCGKKLAS